MQKPLVTIAIASYNHARYVEQAVASVLQQTYPHIEFIVIDDGSSDGSVELLEQLSRQHGFQFIAQANQGLAKTLNRALALATGSYFCPMSSDDVMLPEKTALQVAYMEQHPEVAVCGGNVISIDEHGLPHGKRQKLLPARQLDFDTLFTNRAPAIPAPTAMLRTEILRAVGGYDPEIRLEDFALWLKLTHRGHLMGALPEVLLHYRKHGTNTYKNLRLMYQSLQQTYAPYSADPAYQKVLHNFLISMFLTAAKKNQPELAREVLGQIRLRFYNLKVLRGLVYLLRSSSAKNSH